MWGWVCKYIVVYGNWVCLIILTPCLSYIFVFAVEGMCIDFIWRVAVQCCCAVMILRVRVFCVVPPVETHN